MYYNNSNFFSYKNNIKEQDLISNGWIGLLEWLYRNIEKEENVDLIINRINKSIENCFYKQINTSTIEKIIQDIYFNIQDFLNRGMFFYDTKMPQIGVLEKEYGSIVIITKNQNFLT